MYIKYSIQKWPKSSLQKDPTQLFGFATVFGLVIYMYFSFKLAWRKPKSLEAVFQWCYNKHDSDRNGIFMQRMTVREATNFEFQNWRKI
jgi:hypothetical protein